MAARMFYHLLRKEFANLLGLGKSSPASSCGVSSDGEIVQKLTHDDKGKSPSREKAVAPRHRDT